MRDPFTQSHLLAEPEAHCGFIPVRSLDQYRFARRIYRYIRRHSACQLALLVALTVAIALPLCLRSPLPDRQARTYLVVDAQGPEVIMNYPDTARETELLSIRTSDVGGDAQLILPEGQTVTIRRGDDVCTMVSRLETVDNLLRRAEIVPAEDEMIAVNIAGDAPLIHISDELRYQRSVRTVSPYKTRSFDDYTLEAGTYRLVQKGAPGYVTDVYEDVYRAGRIVDSLLIERRDDTAVTQIVAYGHLVHEVAQDLRAVSAHPFRDGREGGYLLFEDGTSMIYTKTVTCSATAYSGGTRTASGHATGLGVIAVDPTVFPYGTSMYIGSVSGNERVYGIGTAYDCGSAVKGNIIDVWFPTYGECVRWGRRSVTCYILA